MHREYTRPLTAAEKRYLSGDIARRRREYSPRALVRLAAVILGGAFVIGAGWAYFKGNNVTFGALAFTATAVPWVGLALAGLWRGPVRIVRRLRAVRERDEARVLEVEASAYAKFDEHKDLGALWAFQVEPQRLLVLQGQDYYETSRFPALSFEIVQLGDGHRTVRPRSPKAAPAAAFDSTVMRELVDFFDGAVIDGQVATADVALRALNARTRGARSRAPALALAFAALSLGCESRSVADQSRTADEAPAREPVAVVAEYADTLAIRRRVDSIGAWDAAHRDRRKLFAQLEDSASLVPVKDSLSWPEETVASFNITYDSLGKTLAHFEMPTSESGDWYMEVGHFFDADGRTIHHTFHISSFSSGCTSILRETVRTFINPATGAVLATTTEIADAEARAIPDTSKCYLRSADARKPRLRLSELANP